MRTQLKAVYKCVCGEEHEAVTRLAQFPVIVCPQAPVNALYFFPGKPYLVTGKVPPGTIGATEEAPREPNPQGA